MIAAAKAVRSYSCDPPADFGTRFGSHLEALADQHQFVGLAVVDPEPAVLFRIRDGVPDADVLGRILPIVPWAWPGLFGASLTITCHFQGTEVSPRATIARSNEDGLRALLSPDLRFYFVRGRRLLRAVGVDFVGSEVSRANLEAHLAGTKRSPTLFDDPQAHFWEVMKCLRDSTRGWTATDCLQLGWYDVYERAARVFASWLSDFRSTGVLPNAEGVSVAGSIVEFVNAALHPNTDGRRLLDHLHSKFGAVAGELAAFVNDGWVLANQTKDKSEWEELRYSLWHAVHTYNLCPLATDCGRDLPWYNFPSHDFARLRLLPNDFPHACPPDQFWARLPSSGILYGWGLSLGGADVPIQQESLVAGIATMPRADDVDAVEMSANALFEEAIANKRGTIPHRAIVQLHFGPFTQIEFLEIDLQVLAVCRNDDGESLHVICEAQHNHCSFALESEVDSTDVNERVEVAVKLLMAAIIRDFWVIEDRETVFESRRIGGTGVRQRQDDGRPRVVYVPRVRYTSKANVERCASELDQPCRRAHLVRAHIRKSASATNCQIELASRYGMYVPIGYTFVKPHERGKTKRDIVYRSRSALQSMYAVVTEGAKTPIRWFQFERDVHSLMASLGFTVEHIAASRRGDNGVDVFATKGHGLDEVQWIIQCKCWKPSRKVSPNVVRELLGVLTKHSRGIRGMIVTTSGFTSGAIVEAKNAGIRLMGGEEFVQLTMKSNKSPLAN